MYPQSTPAVHVLHTPPITLTGAGGTTLLLAYTYISEVSSTIFARGPACVGEPIPPPVAKEIPVRLPYSKRPPLPSRALGVLCLLVFALAPHARAAGLLIADGGLGGVLEIKEHSVNVVINNGIAVTTVNQVFQNTESRQVEALYTFPVPKNASVANF